MDSATWNVLHDGQVIAVDGTVPGNMRLSVKIAYLCNHLPTKSDHMIVALADCHQFEYQPYEDPAMIETSAIAALGLELLSAELSDGLVTIECADGGYGGRLVIRYRSADLSTAEGQPLSQSEVEAAAERYWSLWQQKNAKP